MSRLLITMLRCQRCRNSQEYNGPQLKGNPRIHCLVCDRTTTATVFIVPHKDSADWTVRIKPPPPAIKPLVVVVDKKPQVEKRHPTPYKPLPDLTKLEQELFWMYVEKGEPDECWYWKGLIDRDRQPRFHIRGAIYSARRLAWKITHPEREIDLLKVGHICNYAHCCNPRHLFDY